MFHIVVMISGAHGRGSTLINLHNACKDGRIDDSCIDAVIGSTAKSPAIERANSAGIATKIVSPKQDNYDTKLLEAISEFQPDLICLAGYMRRIPDTVLGAYAGKIVNIHPALLPAFGGQGMYGSFVHQAVYDYGVKVSGCTVHFIDSEYDSGPIILQKVVPITAKDTPNDIAAKVLSAEQQAYPEAVNLIAKGVVHIYGRRVDIAE